MRGRYYERRIATGTLYHCFNCSKSGIKRDEELTPKQLLERINNLSVIPKQSKQVTEVKLPYDYTEHIPKEGLQWFFKYGIMPELITKYKFGYSPKYNRIILPVFDEGRLVYYQARTLSKPTKDNPKYINVRQSGARNVWFKVLSNIRNDVVIVEDILSACKVGSVTNSIALLGSYIPNELIEVLKPYSSIKLWLDRDKLKEALRYANKLRMLSGKQVSVIIKDLDPKEYSTQNIEGMLRPS